MGTKAKQNDEVVGGHLNHGVGRISLCQRAPDEDHRRAGRRAQQHRARQILGGQLRRDQALENHEEKQRGDAVHGKRLDEPVGDPGDIKALGIFPTFCTLLKSTFIIIG
jgi:hypothetical protein